MQPKNVSTGWQNKVIYTELTINHVNERSLL